VHIIPIDGTTVPIVVRHAWHGGVLARITGDRFLAPTRAPYELHVALQLESIGIRTPRIVAYAIYPAGPLLRRSDIATEEIADGVDLAAILAGDATPVSRHDALHAAHGLLSSMARHGVHHPDLNLKNILVAPGSGGEPAAWLLDVDRVRFAQPAARAANANAERVTRSARKWRDQFGAPISDVDLTALDGAARGRTA
jgi:3-deoxy-D-manno-octulosonic acid kinase